MPVTEEEHVFIDISASFVLSSKPKDYKYLTQTATISPENSFCQYIIQLVYIWGQRWSS